MKEWGFWDMDMCPCGGVADEMTQFTVLCMHEDIVATYNTHTTKFL